MLTTYKTDGQQTVFTFDWPYLERSHVVVTVNDAARPFTFTDDHTLKVVDLYGNPFAANLPLKIFRQTPDLYSYAAFKDAANLTADDLNRARLQVLFLVQERSGGLAGSVAPAISALTNEIETISGALNQLSTVQGTLRAGLGTLTTLSDRIGTVENGATALAEQIKQEIQQRSDGDSVLTGRVDSLEVKQSNMAASFHSDINLLQEQNGVLAAKTDTLQAKIDAIDLTPGDDKEDDTLAASVITSAVASVKKDFALADQITTLSATINDDIKAQLQVEQKARASADQVLAEQITSLQAQIGNNLATVIQDIQTKIDATNGKVTGLSSQYSLKAQVVREDGTVVMGGIGLSSTASDDYVGSKIVLAADSLLFANPNAVNGSLVSILQAGLVDGAPTLVVPSAVVGDKTLPGRVLVDGSVEARSIAAGTITGDKISAGTIDADKLTVGRGANLLTFSEFVETLTGSAQPRGWYSGTTGLSVASMSYQRDPSGYTPVGTHVTQVTTNVVGTAAIAAANYTVYSDPLNVTQGNRYEFSVYAGATGCDVDVGVVWFDAQNAILGTAGFASTDGCFLASGLWLGGVSLSSYYRLGAIATAPASAAYARLYVRKSAHKTGTSSTLRFLRPFFAETTVSATRLSAYSAGGLVTTITPAGISTPSLDALSAVIGLLRTATSGARLEIESNQIRVYDGNNVMRVRMGVW